MDKHKSRTHDAEIYLSENRYDDPKEIFKVLSDKAASLATTAGEIFILDVGCAAGEFSYYLRKRYPDATITGLDVVPSLLKKARVMVPDAHFIEADVHDRKAIGAKSQDVIFMCGVLSIFDRFEPVHRELALLVPSRRKDLHLRTVQSTSGGRMDSVPDFREARKIAQGSGMECIFRGVHPGFRKPHATGIRLSLHSIPNALPARPSSGRPRTHLDRRDSGSGPDIRQWARPALPLADS